MPFLRTSPEDRRTSVNFPEPITQSADRYFRRLSIDDAIAGKIIAKSGGVPAFNRTSSKKKK